MACGLIEGDMGRDRKTGGQIGEGWNEKEMHSGTSI